MWSVKIDLTADQPVNFVFNFPNNFIVAVSVFLTASKKLLILLMHNSRKIEI